MACGRTAPTHPRVARRRQKRASTLCPGSGLSIPFFARCGRRPARRHAAPGSMQLAIARERERALLRHCCSSVRTYACLCVSRPAHRAAGAVQLHSAPPQRPAAHPVAHCRQARVPCAVAAVRRSVPSALLAHSFLSCGGRAAWRRPRWQVCACAPITRRLSAFNQCQRAHLRELQCPAGAPHQRRMCTHNAYLPPPFTSIFCPQLESCWCVRHSAPWAAAAPSMVACVPHAPQGARCAGQLLHSTLVHVAWHLAIVAAPVWVNAPHLLCL